MTSRDRILQRIKENQSGIETTYDDINVGPDDQGSVADKFMNTLINIGGSALIIDQLSKINTYISNTFPLVKNIVSAFPEISSSPVYDTQSGPHALATIEIAILQGSFGVAENGAVWLTETNMLDRALPFICENLMLVIKQSSIISTMHDAYNRIADASYGYGSFIAGPSKTADIEQSLVLGAHGPKTLMVFILQD